jgi:AraC-like DNA-binding protein
VFNAPKDMIVFDTASIEQPLEGGNPSLTQEYDEIINRYLARFDKENILARVKVKLIEKLSTGDFQQQDVAKSLGLSIRSLQRKLSAENTSYSELLDIHGTNSLYRIFKNSSHNITDCLYSWLYRCE